MCDFFADGWFVSFPGSGKQFGQIVAERRNRLAENLADPGLGHPENGGDLKELHVFVVVHCQHFFLQLWKVRHALRQQRDYFFPLQVPRPVRMFVRLWFSWLDSAFSLPEFS